MEKEKQGKLGKNITFSGNLIWRMPKKRKI